MPDTQPTPTKTKSEESNSSDTTPAPEQEQKLSSAVWIVLATAAGALDLVEWGLDAIAIGLVINPVIDIFVGLSLGTFFAVKGMLNWTTGISIFLGFAADFFSAAILPAWIFDIAALWLLTDGAKQLGKVPFFGEQIRQAALVAIQKKAGGVAGEAGSAAGVAEKEAAEASAVKKSVSETKSVDGIKPGTGNGVQREIAKPGEKPPVMSEQGAETPSSRPVRPGGPGKAPEEADGSQKEPVRFGGNLWREYGASRRQGAREKATENAARQFGISKEEAERLAGKNWSNN